MLPSEEVDTPETAAAGQGGVQAERSDGGVPAEGQAHPRPHPASPGGHGPSPAPGPQGAV